MKIKRDDIITIAKNKYELTNQTNIDNVDYNLWLDFIQKYKDYFLWYEDTLEGRDALDNIDKVPDWAKERVLYSLNKKKVYLKNISGRISDVIIIFSDSDKRVSISIEKNLDIKSAKILLKMAQYLDALLLKDGTEVIDEKVIERLSEK